MTAHRFTATTTRKMGRHAVEVVMACAACSMREDWSGRNDPCPSSLAAKASVERREAALVVHRRAAPNVAVCGRILDGVLKVAKGPAIVTCRWCIARSSDYEARARLKAAAARTGAAE